MRVKMCKVYRQARGFAAGILAVTLAGVGFSVFACTELTAATADGEPVGQAAEQRTSGGSVEMSRLKAQLDSLGDNQALQLGTASVVGEFNAVAKQYRLDRTGPQGRDYSIKMVWAPELERALFVGANHGSPHRLNDVWAFDLCRLEWELLYAPDNPRSYLGLGNDASDVIFRDGALMTLRGGPAVIGHTWWGLTYDPEQRRMLFMNTWVADQGELVASLGADPAKRYSGPPLWAFDPHSRKWVLLRTPEPWPRSPVGGMLEYVPALKGAIWHANGWQMSASWLYSPDLAVWRNLNANKRSGDFQSQAPKREQVGYYDPARNIIVAQSGRSTHQLDVATSQWTRVIHHADDDSQVPFGHDARSVFHFDPVSGHGLFLDLRSNKLWSYDPDAHLWTLLAPQGDPMPTGKKRLAYVDQAQNVFVVLKDTTVWVYRYRVRGQADQGEGGRGG